MLQIIETTITAVSGSGQTSDRRPLVRVHSAGQNAHSRAPHLRHATAQPLAIANRAIARVTHLYGLPHRKGALGLARNGRSPVFGVVSVNGFDLRLEEFGVVLALRCVFVAAGQVSLREMHTCRIRVMVCVFLTGQKQNLLPEISV